MNDEQFDKELATLYQKRKSQIVAPSVSLEGIEAKPRSSIIKLCSVFAIGGLASFGIMALVTHLVEKPVPIMSTNDKNHHVDITEIELARNTEEMVLPKVELPPQPEVAAIVVRNESITPLKNGVKVNKVESIAMNMVQTVTLPQLKEPELTITPTYKVMPKFFPKTLHENQSGSIKLSYQIDESGGVVNIEVVESEVNRVLQRSAKKALAKWQYNPKDNLQSRYEIIFEFNSVK